jgi:hypothetical protein
MGASLVVAFPGLIATSVTLNTSTSPYRASTFVLQIWFAACFFFMGLGILTYSIGCFWKKEK